MSFNPPKFIEIRDQLLRDIKSLNTAADISVDSDFFVRASSIAACSEGQYAHQAWIVRQIFPDTADTKFLELHAQTRLIYRKSATIAKGLVRITGEPRATIAAGTEIFLSFDGWADQSYITDIAGTIDADKTSIDIAITATQAGAQFNLIQEVDAPDNAILGAAPAGILSACTLLYALGGTDIETDAALLARLLERIRRPPAGGNRHDYRNWAMAVDGVSNAYVYPLRRGLGSVDIAITSGNGLPSLELISKVQDFIDSMRPVTAYDSIVIAPVQIMVDFEIKVKLQKISLDDATIEIKRVLADYFLRLAPADSVIISQIEALISDLVGIIDRKIITPAQNLTTDVTSSIDWFRCGNVEVSLL